MALSDEKMKKISNAYGLKEFTPFQLDFFEQVMDKDDSDSRYDAFVELSRGHLPSNISEVYDALKKRDYRMKDDNDINVYVDRVASRHLKKFDWMFSSLFAAYQRQLQKDIDIVIWGCGCGLELLALYDQSIRQGNHQFWTVVNSITLIDISEPALKRAKEIAEVLFPLARTISTHQCDLKDDCSIKNLPLTVRYELSTRLHILSNILDLIDKPSVFSGALKEICTANGECNEIFVAMSPGDPSGRVARKMQIFRENWNEVAQEIKTEKNKPFGCEYAFFECNTQRNDPVYAAYLDFPVVANTFHELRGFEELGVRRLAEKLLHCKIDKGYFFDVYKHVRMMGSGKSGYLLVFAPDPGDIHKICFVVFGDINQVKKPAILRRWIEECSEKVADDKILEYADGFSIPREKKSVENTKFWREVFELAVFMGWDGTSSAELQFNDYDAKHGVKWCRQTPIDVSALFRTDVRGVEELGEPKYNQKKIVYGRKQLRMVRGGPGTGKTLSMLVRAQKVLEWRHLPVLVLCKTNTLVGINRKRLLSSFRNGKSVVGDDVERKIHVMTLARYLCSVFYNNNGCWFSDEDMSVQGMRRRNCNVCMGNRVQEILSGAYEIPQHSQLISYGAVLVDEAQVMTTDELQAVYLLTGRGNPWRDFYIFCDEEQSFREDVLVDDDETKRKIVRPPAVGFGQSITLKKNFRTYHPKLIALYKKFQRSMGDKYDIKNLLMEELPEETQSQFGFARPFRISKDLGSYEMFDDFGFQKLKSQVEAILGEIGADTLAVVCDDVGLLRKWYVRARQFGWVLTHHADKLERRVERRDRAAFKECEGKIHLTSVDCAEGQTFRNVLYIVTRNFEDLGAGGLELTFTAVTRAREHLRIIDGSTSAWLYESLKNYNEV